MDEKLKNSINFLRSAYIQAKQSETDKFQMDSETIKIIYDLLKDLSSRSEKGANDEDNDMSILRIKNARL